MTQTGPYASAFDMYWQAGWRGILPLPAKKKKDPPAGFTGGSGIDPSYADMYSWAEGRHADGNIALRLPLDVIGIDVDAYDDKVGGDTFAAAEAAYGKLPATWRTTSRDDGISGIRLFRVPPGQAWEQIGDHIETIQRRHRYAVVWPSIHPEGRTYRWISPDGVVSTVIPRVDDLPHLPQAWVEAYTKGDAVDVPRNDMGATSAATWLTSLPGAASDPCKRMADTTSSDAATLGRADVAAHDTACQATARFVRLAAEGHRGVMTAMTEVHRAFVANVTSTRRGGKVRTQLEAEAEWRDLLVSAVNLVSADMPTAPSCDCDGALTALVIGDKKHTVSTDGSAALAPAHDLDTAETPDSIEHTSWWPRNLGPVLTGEETEPPPTVLTRGDGQPLWYAGKINGLIGESESGKTWIALTAVAQQLEAGERVLYLDFEDAAPGIISRLRSLGVADDDLNTCLHYADPAESLTTAASADLAMLLAENTYSLIVVDGFNAAMTLLGLDLMSNTDVTKFFQLLMRPLAKTGATVAYVDHIGKNAQEDSKGGIGAQAKRAMTTGCVIKVKVSEPFGRGMTGRLGMIVDKDRAGHVRGASGGGRNAGVAVLSSDRESGGVVVELQAPDTATPAERATGKRVMLMEEISAWLATSPENTSKNTIRAMFTGRNDDVEAALAELVRRGFAYQKKVGNGFQHGHVKPFTVAEDLAGSADLAHSPHLAPTSPGANGADPSNDLAPSPRLYRRGEGESTEPGAGRDMNSSQGRGEVSAPFETLDCNGCGDPKPAAIIETFKGYCAPCSRERG